MNIYLTKRIKQFILFLFLPFWHLQKLIPRNKRIWIFGDRFGKKYSDNTQAFHDFVVTNYSDKVEAVWITRNKEVYILLRKRNLKVYYAWSIKGIIYSLRAGVVFYSVSKKDINRHFINGAILVNTWHGAPMKKIGLLKEKANRYAETKLFFFKYFFPSLYEFDMNFLVNTSPFFDEVLMKSFGLKKEQLLLTGYPRNDIMFTDTKDSFIKELDSLYDEPYKILYLPTWRSSEMTSISLFDSSTLMKWNEYLYKSNCIFLYKDHPERKSNFNCLLDSNPSKRFIRIEDTIIENINNVMKSIDVLITDYSGAYFDFILLKDKNVILFPYDYNNYEVNDSGFSLDYGKEIIGTRCYSWEEILKVIKARDFIKPIDNKFNCYRDGKSSERLYSQMMKL